MRIYPIQTTYNSPKKNNTSEVLKSKAFKTNKAEMQNSSNINFLGLMDIFFRESKRNFRQEKAELKSLMERDPEFSDGTINDILYLTRKDNIDLARMMIQDKDFIKTNIKGVLKKTDSKNVEAKIEIYNFAKKYKDSFGNCWRDNIFYLLHDTNHYNLRFAKTMVSDDDFPKDDINIVLFNTNKYSEDAKIEMFKFLKEYKKDLEAEWNYVVRDVESYVTPTNIELAKKIIKDKEFPKEDIGKVLTRINYKNLELAKIIISDKDFPKDSIKNILSDTDSKNINAKIEMYNFIKDHKESFKDYYKETLCEGVQNADGNNINLKKEMYEKVSNSYKSPSLLSSVVSKTTHKNVNDIEYVIDEVSKNKKKFGQDYIYVASCAISSGDYDFLKEYINNPEWYNNKTVKELIGAIIWDDKIEDKADFTDYLLKSNFNADEIRRYKKNHYHIGIQKLQNTYDWEIVLRRTKKISDKEELTKFARFKKNGDIIKSVCKTTTLDNKRIKEETRMEDGKYSCISYYKDGDSFGNILQDETRIISNDFGPVAILKTQASPIIKGAYDITFYDLDGIEEDVDVLKAIENGELKGRELVKTSQNTDGTIIHTETFQKGEYFTKREYSTSPDKTKTSLKYTIENLEGEKLLNLERSFESKGNRSLTTVNGKEYTALFVDDTYTAIIQDDERNVATIDFSQKIHMDNSDKLWELIKHSPADTILNFKDIKTLKYDDECSWFYKSGGSIFVNESLGSLAHEIGHYKDTTANGTIPLQKICTIEELYGTSERNGKISINSDLIKIYNDEIEQFKNEISESEGRNIWYFSPIGGSTGTGLCEMVAEVNTLCTTDKIDNLETRELYLMRHFPRTIAKAAELLGYK